MKAVAASGQLGIFQNGYWGHPAMRLSPEVNLLAFTHYVQALEYQRKALQVVGMLGSKTPHIQNLVVGGVSNAIDLDSQSALDMDKLETDSGAARRSRAIHQSGLSDRCLRSRGDVSGVVQDRQRRDELSGGAGSAARLANAGAYDLPGGVIMHGDIGGVQPFKTASDPAFRESVTEDVTHAYYEGDKPLHPWQGETEPQFTGLGWREEVLMGEVAAL